MDEQVKDFCKVDMIEVYRVEDERGAGPYRGPSSIMMGEMGADHSDSKHPCIEEDNSGIIFEEDMKYQHLFGFDSLDQLFEWFEPKYRTEMHKWAFRIAVYQVPEYAVVTGDHQLIFQEHLATRIDTLALD